MNIKNKNYNVDILLKRALNSSETPDIELMRKVKYELIKEEPILRKSTLRRSFSAAAAVVTALLIITTTAFATWYFLKPGEVAKKLNDRTLSEAFESETATNINVSVTSGDYTFTLLGIVTGRDITDYPSYINGEIHNDRTYSVVAIQKVNGNPMPSAQDDDYGNPSFYVSPYVKGLKPWEVNAHTMNGGYSEMVVDGIMYRITDCDEVTMFADRGLYLGINTGSFYNSQAFIFDEQTGELGVNPDYDGVSVIFDLPFDKTLADPERAQQYLDNIFSEPDVEIPGDDSAVERWGDVDWDKAVPVASTIKELTIAETGETTFTYDFEHGGGTITVNVKEYFADNETNRSVIVYQIASDDVLYAIRFSIDENGIITGMVIMPE